MTAAFIFVAGLVGGYIWHDSRQPAITKQREWELTNAAVEKMRLEAKWREEMEARKGRTE